MAETAAFEIEEVLLDDVVLVLVLVLVHDDLVDVLSVAFFSLRRRREKSRSACRW